MVKKQSKPTGRGRPRKAPGEKWRPVLLSLTPARYKMACSIGRGSPQHGIYRLLDAELERLSGSESS